MQVSQSCIFFISIVGSIIFAAGVLGGFVHTYFGLALFIVILIMGFVGSIKEYLKHSQARAWEREMSSFIK